MATAGRNNWRSLTPWHYTETITWTEYNGGVGCPVPPLVMDAPTDAAVEFTSAYGIDNKCVSWTSHESSWEQDDRFLGYAVHWRPVGGSFTYGRAYVNTARCFDIPFGTGEVQFLIQSVWQTDEGRVYGPRAYVNSVGSELVPVLPAPPANATRGTALNGYTPWARVTPDARGNMNTLEIWIVNSAGSTVEIAEFRIGNNPSTTFAFDGWRVQIEVRGRDQVRQLRLTQVG
jgi:hypothetical protein